MKCKNLCGKDLTGRQKEFCSDKCRMAHKRKPEQPKSNKPEQVITRTEVEHPMNLCESIRKKSVSQLQDEGIVRPDPIKSDIPVSEGPLSSSESRREEREYSARLTANDLYVAIRNYPQDSWKGSLEYKELMRRLHKMSIEELEQQGYWIPTWRYQQEAA